MGANDEENIQNRFIALEDNEVPDLGAVAETDLYIYLPYAQKHLCFVLKGERWDSNKKDILTTHVDNRLYKTMNDALGDSIIPTNALDSENDVDSKVEENVQIFKAEAHVPQEIRIFKDNVEEELSSIFSGILKTSDPQQRKKTLSSLQKLSEKVIETVAPDVEDLRSSILNNSKYLMVMADSAAITSISILMAMAHGFNSRKVFRDLSTAILLMDSPLAELSEETVNEHYSSSWPERPSDPKITEHPQLAYNAISRNIPAIPEPVLQLVLNHHELYNGKGYPRGIRNEQLPPIIRSLCLAVDVFEIMKQHKLRESEEIDILTALNSLKEKDVEAHLRRHNQRLVSEAIEYIYT